MYEYAYILPDEGLVSFAEMMLNCRFGPVLREYLLKYGYLANENAELYGLTGQAGDHAYLISRTRMLGVQPDYVNIRCIDVGLYELVDMKDMLFLYDASSREIVPTGMSFATRIESIISGWI